MGGGGGGKGAMKLQLPPPLPPTVLGLDPEIRANPLRNVKVVEGVGTNRGCASTGTVGVFVS